MLTLNETPVRTSRNFNSNHVKLDHVILPEVIQHFDNVTVINDASTITIDQSTKPIPLTYGISKDIEQLVYHSKNANFHINIEGKNNQETWINFELDEDNQTLLDYLQITAHENSHATVMIQYASLKGIEAFHNGIIHVEAKENANLHLILINLCNEQTQNWISVENVLQNHANVDYTVIDFGGKNSITNYYANLVGKYSQNHIHTIYLGKHTQLFDLNYIAELRGERTNISMEVQGALKDTATKHFKGTIDFKKGCKKAIGNENESCMLLSDTAKSLALPMLLCSEEEVEGNHSTSTGKVGEKELFYMMSRGFSMQEALKLLVKAKFNKILENITNYELKNKILSEIENKLDDTTAEEKI